MASFYYEATTCLQAFFVIFFVIQFCLKNSILRTSYFIIYTVGLVISVITNYDWINGGFFPKPVSKALTVYSFVSPITIHATLIFNRCTALWFPLKVHKIWTLKNTLAIILLNLAFPFIIFGFYFYQIYFVELDKTQKSANERTKSIIQVYFSTISIILIIATVIICSKRKITTFSDKFAKVEKRLIYQSITVLLLVEADCLIWQINNILNIGHFPYIVYEIGDYIIPVYQLLDIIILFLVSESFRTSVFKFVTLGFYGPKVITVTSITNTQTLNSQLKSQKLSQNRLSNVVYA